MKKTWIILAVLAVLTAGSYYFSRLIPHDNVLVASGHPEYPPFMWQEGSRIIGVGPELLQIAFDELGIKVDARADGTWNEVIKKASEGKIDAVAALYRTDERQKFLNYSTSFSKDPVAIFVSKKRSFPYQQWDDLIGKAGTTTIGDSYGQVFDDFMRNKLEVNRLKTVEDNFNQLLNAKADYFVFALYPGLLES
ncbi:MAG: transporter substrate-binding domain-containing protein [Candidatus Omnitrophica bacterium]|nr:transporter substrate-binding domain-containing protein [Candidatus Omnitrophota bacterium]